jgi:isocitrate dehydrogenase
MMFDYMGWIEAAARIRSALEAVIRSGRVTYDLARQMPGAQEVSCSGFASGMIDRMKG